MAYFPTQCARNSVDVLPAVLASLKNAGIQLIENSMDCDAAIIWSVLWQGRMAANQFVYEQYRQQGKPVIIVEVGALHRGITWKVAVNNVTADGYYGHRDNLDLDRPRKLGIALKQKSVNNPNILLTAQHSKSLQLSGITSIEHWLLDQIKEIRKVTDRHILIRPHPRSPINRLMFDKFVKWQNPTKIANTYDDFDFGTDYHAIVNYNSGPGIQAALNGTPVVVDQTSLAHPVSISIDTIENPGNVDREQWLIELCHTEYTLEELKQGLWLKRLRRSALQELA